jgi:hypothetical protein
VRPGEGKDATADADQLHRRRQGLNAGGRHDDVVKAAEVLARRFAVTSPPAPPTAISSGSLNTERPARSPMEPDPITHVMPPSMTPFLCTMPAGDWAISCVPFSRQSRRHAAGSTKAASIMGNPPAHMSLLVDCL